MSDTKIGLIADDAAGRAGGGAPSGGAPARPAVGREVRRWRHTRALTLAQVAARSGHNVGYLSQIENEKAVPSLDALILIAGALDVPPAWLLLDSAPVPRVVRARERPGLPMGGMGRATEVDGGTSRDLCIIEVVVPSGGGTGMHAHAGDEHHVILEGTWRMIQGEHEYILGPGDYLAWDPSVPHDAQNAGDTPARALLIYPRHGRRGEPESRGGA